MPRPNPNRALVVEEALARRIGEMRVAHGWSYEGLAKRMADAGCPIQPSAIYKIEKADPPRRITVSEVVAFAEVFDEPIEELLSVTESSLFQAVLLSHIDGVKAAGERASNALYAYEHEVTALDDFLERHQNELAELRQSRRPSHVRLVKDLDSLEELQS